MSYKLLERAIVANTAISSVAAKQAVDAVISTIKDSLIAGESFNLKGFGTFSVSQRSARIGRNPQTGDPLQIAASKAAKFKPSKVLNELIK